MRKSETQYVGDLLISFNLDKLNFKNRGGSNSWEILIEGPNWKLLELPISQTWAGFPSSSYSNEYWEILILGEFYKPNEKFYEQLPRIIDENKLEKIIPQLNGRFIIIAFHKPSKEWRLWTDRFGTIHVYYGVSGDKATIGTFFPAVADDVTRKELDWYGIAGFFEFGFFPEDRTYYKDIKILRPATCFRFDQNGKQISSEQYWQWWHEPNSNRSFDETIDEYHEIFSQVVKDYCQGGQIALPISGGLDSRSTLVPIENNSPEIWSYSYGYSTDSIETRIAQKISRVKNLTFSTYTIKPYLFNDLFQILAWTEGFQDVTQSRQVFVRNEIQDHAEFLIGGLWGDVWHDSMGIDDQKNNQFNLTKAAYRKLQKRGGRWLVENVAKPHFGQENPYSVLLQMVSGEISTVSHLKHDDFKVKAFKTNQWSFRWSIPPTRVFQSAVWPRLVFYDHRLSDFFCSVPTEFVKDRRLQIEHMKRHAPSLARITWQTYDANLYNYPYFNSILLPKRALKKGWRTLRGVKTIERNWEIQFGSDFGNRGINKWLLHSNLKLHESVPKVKIKQLVDNFYDSYPNPSYGYTLSLLLTFSAWLELHG
jgi:asparagine synthase (glutamine-hydrolysing)